MSRNKITLGLKVFSNLFNSIFSLSLILLLIFLLAACSVPAPTTQAPTLSVSEVTTQTSSSIATTTATKTPTATAAAPKPQGEVIVALQGLGGENWLPWVDPQMSNLHNLVYDMLIYWDHANLKFFPGLAESWENSPDGLTLTYHLRKGVQWQDGWGEFTSADVKFSFEMQASTKSVGKVSQCRRIASMETSDPYTLVVHFKDPYPTFYVDMSMANSGTCQGIVCKKYLETVGDDVAGQKPVGTGPYKLVESQPGSYYKFEARDDNWRVVPEFKTLTGRLIPETSTLVAALKNKELDLSQVPSEQMVDLKASGVAVEASPFGGAIIMAGLGGMIIPSDKRYDPATHNKDPWTDVRVRKAMAIAIDRQGICKAIFAGYADPAGVPLITSDYQKYQYTYDPAAAKQLLKDAGYPNGFSFRVVSYIYPGTPEMPRIAEALAGYWQQIGLDPKITVISYNTYYSKNIVPCKTAGDVFPDAIGLIADMMSRTELFLFPNNPHIIVQDEGSYAIYKNNPSATFEERNAMVDKLNQYYYENVLPIPVLRKGLCYAWNSDKVSPWPHWSDFIPSYFEYVRHAKPLNTYSLFRPWPDR